MSRKMIEKVLEGDQRTIAKLITLLEYDSPLARETLRGLHKYTGNSHIIGVTGPPGVGKSSLIDKLIGEYRKRGKSVGVLAVDSTSPFTGGALLGDRVRMKEHTLDDKIFIRSMGSRGGLGGLSRATGNAMKVLDASGKEVIIVETIGVGQTQVDIAKYAHTVLVVLMPKMGDDIQAMKTGIYEVGDIFVVNKADLENADRTVMELEDTLGARRRLSGELQKKDIDWRIPVMKTTATTGVGVPELVDKIEKHMEYLANSKNLEKLLEKRVKAEILDLVSSRLEEYVIRQIPEMDEFKSLLQKTASGEIDPGSAADIVLKTLFFKQMEKNRNST